MKRILCFMLLSLALATSCMNEDDATPVVIYVTPSVNEVSANDKFYFEIYSKSVNSQLILFEVSTFDKTNGSEVIHSIEPMSQVFSDRLICTARNFAEDQEVEYTFSATDGLGYKQTVRINILVRSNSTAIEELTGITLYSPLSGKNDAFSFDLKQSVNSKTALPNQIDLYVAELEEGSETLSRSWKSNTELRFCRVNSFNYSAATYSSISTVFSNSVTEPVIDDLSIGDIVFVGRDGVAIAVIRIANIYDESGVIFDRYDIDIKVVDNTTPPTEDEGNNDSSEDTPVQ